MLRKKRGRRPRAYGFFRKYGLFENEEFKHEEFKERVGYKISLMWNILGYAPKDNIPQIKDNAIMQYKDLFYGEIILMRGETHES